MRHWKPGTRRLLAGALAASAGVAVLTAFHTSPRDGGGAVVKRPTQAERESWMSEQELREVLRHDGPREFK
ncbi:hypothetical protein [Streptomyces ochraceiscleroticus]|uniref:Uncharacterized protein n=1 Tax=Streptomyces ochraceiscleroticus TaxID=47761 RepID=A0ABW1MNE9_9ACTN|nr:hypothetical protein [Streptomyces ochraceiscleroticus]